MQTLDLVTILAYLAIIFIIGAAFTRKAHKNTESYFLSGRGLPWWIAGTSMVATSFSCDTPLYVTRLIRSGGISLNWQWWSFAIGGLFSAFLLARLWRRANVVTDVELTELRYGGKAGQFLRYLRAGWMALIINTISMSWVVLAMAKIIGVTWGGPKWIGVLVAAALAVSYSFLAGFWGVVVTDVAQFVIAMIGAVALAIFAVNAAGGMENIIQTVGLEKLSFVPHIPPDSIFTGQFWLSAFGGFIVYASIQWWANINSDGGGKVIQRMSAAKNEAHAFGATLWFNVAHYALRTWPWIIVALASIVLLPDLADDELAYPTLILTILPTPWVGILIAGLIAAFMSTVDTQLNWGASYLTHDLYKRWLAPGKSEKHYILAAKVSMLLLIFLTGIISYFISSVTEAFKFLIAFGAGLGPVLILRWFWWRINAWSEITAMIASTVISSLVYIFVKDISFPVKVLTITFGSAFFWVPITFMTKKVSMDTLVSFYARTRTPGAWGPVRRQWLIDEGPQPIKEKISGDLFGWIGGIMLTFGLTFSIGYFSLLNPLNGTISLAISIIGAVIVYFWMKSRFSS